MKYSQLLTLEYDRISTSSRVPRALRNRVNDALSSQEEPSIINRYAIIRQSQSDNSHKTPVLIQHDTSVEPRSEN